MKLTIRTRVGSDLQTVKAGFDESLFTSLSPPFPTVHLKRFDGSSKGDIVSLELNFLLFKQVWTSKIIDDSEDKDQWIFVDEGIQLPFFLSSWLHTHRVIAQGRKSIIEDDISFHTGTILTDWLMIPVLYLQFAYRKPLYRKRFAAIKHQAI